jgi:hypothetical protein
LAKYDVIGALAMFGRHGVTWCDMG